MHAAVFARFSGDLFLIAVASVVLMQLLTGGVSTRHLLHGRRKDGTAYFSPQRVQLLVVTLGVAFNYVISACGDPQRPTLPDLTAPALSILGISHIIYLASKAYERLAA